MQKGKNVAAVVFENAEHFNENDEKIEEAFRLLDKNGPPEHIWDSMAAVSEQLKCFTQ